MVNLKSVRVSVCKVQFFASQCNEAVLSDYTAHYKTLPDG